MNSPADQVTRCPACKTVFRVVPDQLRVSEGWVRCGRCGDVFNAHESRVNLASGWTRSPLQARGGASPAGSTTAADEQRRPEARHLPERAANRARQDAELERSPKVAAPNTAVGPASGTDLATGVAGASQGSDPPLTDASTPVRPTPVPDFGLSLREQLDDEYDAEAPAARLPAAPLPSPAPASDTHHSILDAERPLTQPASKSTPPAAHGPLAKAAERDDDNDLEPAFTGPWHGPMPDVVASHEPWEPASHSDEPWEPVSFPEKPSDPAPVTDEASNKASLPAEPRNPDTRPGQSWDPPARPDERWNPVPGSEERWNPVTGSEERWNPGPIADERWDPVAGAEESWAPVPGAEERWGPVTSPAPPEAGNSWAPTQPADDLDPVAGGQPKAQPVAEASTFGESWQPSHWPQSLPPSVVANLRGLRMHAPAVIARAKPSFMRQAEREQRWRKPHMRALLNAGLAAAALLLFLQVLLANRDHLAARYALMRTVLVSLCGTLGCSVQPARAIEQLTVESSGLVKTRQAAQYQLQVSLRNRSALELALPALDVTVTDAQGDLIARKVLLPRELGSTIDRRPGSHGGVIAPGKEVTLQGLLMTPAGELQVIAGYTLELFYP